MPKTTDSVIAAAEAVIKAEAAELAQLDAEIEVERREPEVVIQFGVAQATLRNKNGVLSEYERLLKQQEARVQEIRSTSTKVKAAVEARRTSVDRLRIFVSGIDEFTLRRLMDYDDGTAALAFWGESVGQRQAIAEDQVRYASLRLDETSDQIDEIKRRIASLERTDEVRDYLARNR